MKTLKKKKAPKKSPKTLGSKCLRQIGRILDLLFGLHYTPLKTE